ncbi:hypothetical protein NMY22_g4701 [Coprinellus aureogranulatus]|nr:hypothetical protein NMY22_g4701 [Coprinellus aureogranulatus]
MDRPRKKNKDSVALIFRIRSVDPALDLNRVKVLEPIIGSHYKVTILFFGHIFEGLHFEYTQNRMYFEPIDLLMTSTRAERAYTNEATSGTLAFGTKISNSRGKAPYSVLSDKTRPYLAILQNWLLRYFINCLGIVPATVDTRPKTYGRYPVRTNRCLTAALAGTFASPSPPISSPRLPLQLR